MATEVALAYDGPPGGPVHPEGAHAVVRLACLVPRSSEEHFFDALDDAMADVGDDAYAEVTGPWPPYHFVSLPELVDGEAGPS